MDALRDLAHDGVVLALDGDGKLPCKQRKAGDEVSASLVEVSGWWMKPGAGAPVATERQVAIARLLQRLVPEGAPLTLEPGSPQTGPASWLTWPTVAPSDLPALAEPADRAAHAFTHHVSEWIPQWVALVGALPELAGGQIDVAWPVDKAKGALLRFKVPKEAAARWLAGDLGDDGLSTAMTITWSPDPRKTPFTELVVDVEAGPRRNAPAPKLPSVDIDEEDLKGLEDEEP